MQNHFSRWDMFKYSRPRPVKDLSANLKSSYRCVTGQHLLQFPVKMLQCGHRMCSICYEEMLKGVAKETELNKVIYCPGDDEECKDTNIEFISPDYGTDKDLKRLLVYCLNESRGCEEQMQWQHLEEHFKNCDFYPVECKNINFGCKQVLANRDIASHLSECIYSPIKCVHCENDITKKEMQEGHEKQCESKPRKCHFQGCEFEGLKQEVKTHMNEDHGAHLSLLLEKLTLHGQRQPVLKDEIVTLLKNTFSIKDEICTERSKCVVYFDKVKDKLGLLEKFIEKNGLKLEDIAGAVAELNKIQAVQNKFHDHEKRISHVESMQVGRVSGISQEFISRLRNNQQAVTNHERRIDEYDLRFQCLETASFDGVLLWKIGDYKRRKDEAVAGITTSLYSQPFYTSKSGYKMCARVFLNGDGLGRGSHISLFFVVMKGDFDALQHWPFSHKVNFQIFDLEGNKHITDTFRPDISSTSFKRPTTEMNIASGCPLFAEQSELERGTRYIQDDTLYFKIKVHMV